MKIVIGLLALLAALVAAMYLLGRRLPREHSASKSVRVSATPAAIFGALVDVDAFPRWRPEVRSVEKLGEIAGKRRYRETSGHGALTFEVAEEAPGARLVTVIVDEGQPFGGRWTFDLRPAEGLTQVTITEDGFVDPPIFRFLTHHVFGQTATMETYLKNLVRRFETTSK